MIELKHILRYLEGTASPNLATKVEDWVAENAANKKSFDQTKLLWEESSNLGEYYQFDTNQEWKDFTLSIQKSTPAGRVSKVSAESREVRNEANSSNIELVKETLEAKVLPISEQKSWRNILSIAASVAVLVAATWFFWPQSKYIEIVDSATDQELILDDGSVVQISEGASLKTLRSYKYATERKAVIKGEVNFDVVSDESKAFIVETKETAVRVLGTKFNVIASSTESEVANEEGKVRFFVLEDETKFIDLNEGDRIKYDGTDFIDLNEPEPEPEPVRIIPKVRDILGYLRTISNGGVTFGSGIKENELADLDIDYEGKSVREVIQLIRATGAIVVTQSNNIGCPSCIEIVEIKVPRK